MRRFGGPVALVLVAAALAGCGGDGDGAGGVPTGTEAPLEGVDAYVEQARAADATIRGAADRLAAGTTTGELEGMLDELEQAVRRLEQATPPYDLLPEHQVVTQSMWEAVDAGQAVVAEEEERVTAPDLAPVVDALDEASAALDGMEDKGYEMRRRT